jgi:sirohydrochlorin ferrochelatase
VCDPSRHLGTQPELDATLSEINGRSWHVVVAPLVLADGVAMSKVQDVGDALCVDEVVDCYLFGHRSSLQMEADLSDAPASF